MLTFLPSWAQPIVALPLDPESYGEYVIAAAHYFAWLFVALYLTLWPVLVVNVMYGLQGGSVEDETRRKDLRELRILLTIWPVCFLLVMLFGVYAMAPIAAWMALQALRWALHNVPTALVAGARMAITGR